MSAPTEIKLPEIKLPGRPRCEETRGAILRAAHELLESGGLGAFTIEAVAERSGAAKTTIYRWWPNKGALAMESLLGVAETLSPFPETESARADLRVHLHLYATALRGRAGKLLSGHRRRGAEGSRHPRRLHRALSGPPPSRRPASAGTRHGPRRVPARPRH